VIFLKSMLAVLALASLAFAQEPPQLEQARDASRALTAILKALLTQEMANGGPAAAVDACSRSAQQVTREFSRDAGFDVRRVSLKNRNGAGAPDAWERRILTEWQASGKPPKDFHEVTGSGPRRELRYLQPITVQPVCLACHGAPSEIPPEVKQVLDRTYPADKATGYKTGDLRGAISVRISLAE
jgi:hypothetical protein